MTQQGIRLCRVRFFRAEFKMVKILAVSTPTFQALVLILIMTACDASVHSNSIETIFSTFGSH